MIYTCPISSVRGKGRIAQVEEMAIRPIRVVKIKIRMNQKNAR